MLQGDSGLGRAGPALRDARRSGEGDLARRRDARRRSMRSRVHRRIRTPTAADRPTSRRPDEHPAVTLGRGAGRSPPAPRKGSSRRGDRGLDLRGGHDAGEEATTPPPSASAKPAAATPPTARRPRRTPPPRPRNTTPPARSHRDALRSTRRARGMPRTGDAHTRPRCRRSPDPRPADSERARPAARRCPPPRPARRTPAVTPQAEPGRGAGRQLHLGTGAQGQRACPSPAMAARQVAGSALSRASSCCRLSPSWRQGGGVGVGCGRRTGRAAGPGFG